MSVIRREFQVAFSRRAQPVWLRILKWIVIAGLVWRFYGRPHFWEWALGFAIAGLGLHFFYRWKTKGWTRRWGGWNDIDPRRG